MIALIIFVMMLGALAALFNTKYKLLFPNDPRVYLRWMGEYLLWVLFIILFAVVINFLAGGLS